MAACTICAPGFAGTVSGAGTLAAAGCAACGAGTFSLAGAAACSPLPTGATLPLASLAPAQALLVGGTEGSNQVLSSTEIGLLSGFNCIVTEAGPIFCWPQAQYIFAGGANAVSFFVPVPPGVNATRFVSVQIARFSVVGLLDTGALVVSYAGGFPYDNACPPPSSRLQLFDAGPYAEVSSYPAVENFGGAWRSCAIRGDGELECWQWAFPSNDPAQLPLLAPGLFNLTAAKQPSNLCNPTSATCVSTGGPYRSLAFDFEGRNQLTNNYYAFHTARNFVLVCVLRVADGAPFCAGQCLCINCPCQSLGSQGFGLPAFRSDTSGLLPNLVSFASDWSAPQGPSYLQSLKNEVYPGATCSMSSVSANAAGQAPYFPAPQAGFQRLVLGAEFFGAYIAGIAPNMTLVQSALYGGSQWCGASQNSMFVYALQAGDVLSSTEAAQPPVMQCTSNCIGGVSAISPNNPLPFSPGYFGNGPLSSPPWAPRSMSTVNIADLRTYQYTEQCPGGDRFDLFGDTLLLSGDGRISSIPSLDDQVYRENGNWRQVSGMPWTPAKFRYFNSAPDYLALARGTWKSLCLLTKSLTAECYSIANSGCNLLSDYHGLFRSDGPWIPSAPLSPVLFLAGLRGRDEVCVHVPFVENYSPNVIAAQQFRVRCFGDQTAVDFALPVTWTPLRWTPFASLSAGAATLCASDASQNTTCWGECNLDAPVVAQFGGMCVLPATNAFAAASPGLAHTCALSAAGAISCFSTAPALTFAPGPPFSFASVASADAFTCAVASNSSLVCFGDVAAVLASAQAQAARSAPSAAFAAVLFSNASLVTIAGPFSAAASSAGALAAGAAFACALAFPSGAPLCFGDNSTGQLAAPFATPLSTLALGAAHACGVALATAAPVCWGNDTSGQVSGAAAYASTPMSALALTLQSSCGLSTGGVLKCWGALSALMGVSIRSPSPPSLARVASLTVGAPGASDALCAQAAPCASAPASVGCAQTLACATLAGAVAALVGNPALRALPVRGITVLASHTSAPIAVPSWLAPGLLIAGAAGAAPPVVTFAAPSPGTTLIWIGNTGVVLSNLVVDGSAAPGCDTALAVVGLYNYANNVTFRGLRCSRAIVTATSGSAAAAAVAPSGTAYAYNTFELNTVAFTNVSAPVYVSVVAQPAVGVIGATAVHTTGGLAGFLAVWGGAVQVTVARSTLANFATLAGAISPPAGAGVSAAQGAALFVVNSPLTTISGVSISNVSSASGGAALCVIGTGVIRPRKYRSAGRAAHPPTHDPKPPAPRDSHSRRSTLTPPPHAPCPLPPRPPRAVLSVTDMTVAGAASAGNGGAVSVTVAALYAAAGASVLLTRVNVSGAGAAGSGGALFVSAPGLGVLVASSTFYGSRSAGGSGGAIAVAAAACDRATHLAPEPRSPRLTGK